MLHYTAMASARAACDWLCDPASQVSAHYLIAEDGTLIQMVAEDRRAWHAGAGTWGGRGDVNSRSIGIELANPGNAPFAAPLMATLERLLAAIMARLAIPPQAVIGHSDMAPGRKIDPGPRFDWRRLARRGLASWPWGEAGPEPARRPEPVRPAAPGAAAARDDADPAALRAALRRVGYPAEVEDAILLSAFRLRFRPWARGPLDARDIALARDLALRFPVDPGPGGA